MGNGAIVQLKVIFYNPFTNGLQRGASLIPVLLLLELPPHSVDRWGAGVALSFVVVRCGFAN